MKCLASLVLFILSCVFTVFARKQLALINVDGYTYACYDDGRATLKGSDPIVHNYFIIPDTVNYQGKDYHVSIIQANSLKNATYKWKIVIPEKNRALLLKKHSLNGVKNIGSFEIRSKVVEPEIDAFDGIDLTTNFKGAGIPPSVEKLAKSYLKKWKLPFGKDYQKVTESERIQDLYTLAKNFQRTFSISKNASYPNNAAYVAFTKIGGRDGIARLYRIMAMVMGFTEEQILVGCDNKYEEYYRYCWNYIYADLNNSGDRMWYVIDPLRTIPDNSTFSHYFFLTENDFINNTLKPIYTKSNAVLLPFDFIIHLDVYNFEGEQKIGTNMNFDDWISRNNMYGRTKN